MKTTLSLEEDVFKAVKQLARRQHLTLGEVASSLLRNALTPAKAKRPTARRVRHEELPLPHARA
jgi:predicted DNA-binding ribbon-helix-helix protein